MNLMLIESGELQGDGIVRLEGRRLAHLRDVLRLEVGERVRVGLVGGAMGDAEIVAIEHDSASLRVELGVAPPARCNVDVVLAMPRPKQLKRVLPALASLGVNRIVLLNAARVEKSYFASTLIDPQSLRAFLCEGLEQARDTMLPTLELQPLFRPFVEDELSAWAGPEALRLVADPSGELELAKLTATSGSVVLAIGPEGGWVPFELALLRARGFTAVSAGPRILRVDVAVPYLLGLLACRGGPSCQGQIGSSTP